MLNPDNVDDEMIRKADEVILFDSDGTMIENWSRLDSKGDDTTTLAVVRLAVDRDDTDRIERVCERIRTVRGIH